MKMADDSNCHLETVPSCPWLQFLFGSPRSYLNVVFMAITSNRDTVIFEHYKSLSDYETWNLIFELGFHRIRLCDTMM